MANNYLSLSFSLSPTPEEKALLFECRNLANELDDLDVESDDAHALYAQTSEHFQKVFPLMEHATSPFEKFLMLFADPDYPHFEADFLNEDYDDKGLGLVICGDNACPDTLAALIQKCAPSVLPFGFEWAYHSDKMRPGQFGGGFFIVTADKILGSGTSSMMCDALKMLEQNN